MKTIPYGHQWLDKNDIKEVVKALASDWLTQGPMVKEFERKLCDYTGTKYAVAVSSGTAALHLACLAAGLKPGSEVITTPLTFLATANSILYCGARPVFADIQFDTLNIDPEEITKKINKKTKGIIPVHFAGHPCDSERISAIANKHGLIVIEDAAHALGAQYKNTRVGSCRYCDMTIFSFHPIKSITTGEGGMVLTNNKKYYEKIILLRSHGVTRERKSLTDQGNGDWYYEMQQLGFNYRITDFQCALGVSQLEKLDNFIARRRSIAKKYNEAFKSEKDIIIPVEEKGAKSSWHIYPIRISPAFARDDVFRKLSQKGIGVNVHYIPVHLQPYYRDTFGYKVGDFPVAEEYYRRTLTLPLFPGMTLADVKYVINNLKNILKRSRV